MTGLLPFSFIGNYKWPLEHPDLTLYGLMPTSVCLVGPSFSYNKNSWPVLPPTMRPETDLLHPILLTHLWFPPWLPFTLSPTLSPSHATSHSTQLINSTNICSVHQPAQMLGRWGGWRLTASRVNWMNKGQELVNTCSWLPSSCEWIILGGFEQFSGKVVESSPLCPQPW